MVLLPTYDEKVVSISKTPSVFGLVVTESFSPLPAWQEASSFPFTVSSIPSSLQYYGVFNFDFGVTLDSENRALAPTIPFTNVTSDLAGTGETDRYWTFTLGTTEASTNSDTIIYMVSNPSSELPSLTNVIKPSMTPDPYIVQSLQSSDAAWVLNGSVYDITISMDFNATLTTVGGTVVTNAIHKIINDPKWNGRVQIFVGPFSVAASFTATFATFGGLTQTWHTGGIGLDINRRARVVHDYVSGFPYLSDEAIADPWRDGIMVHYSSADPDEKRKHYPYVPPPQEGAVEDDIPKVE